MQKNEKNNRRGKITNYAPTEFLHEFASLILAAFHFQLQHNGLKKRRGNECCQHNHYYQNAIQGGVYQSRGQAKGREYKADFAPWNHANAYSPRVGLLSNNSNP